MMGVTWRSQAAVALLLASLICSGAFAEVSLPVLDESAWTLRPDWIGDPRERSADASYTVRDGIAHLHVPEPGRSISAQARPAEPVDLAALPYVKVRYRAVGVSPAAERGYFLYLNDTDGGSISIRLSELLLNGKWHTQIIEPHASIVADEVALHLGAGPEGGELQIASIEFLPAYPTLSVAESLSLPVEPPAEAEGFRVLTLGDLATAAADEVRERVGLIDWFAAEEFAYGGVPFRTGSGGDAAAIPKMDAGRLTVPCDAAATELHFIVATRLPAWQPRPFTHWGVRKRAFSQVERFRVWLDYADGTTDEAFPWCPDTDRFELCRGLKSYCVPAAGKPLRGVRFAYDFRNASLYLCALTARTGEPLMAAACEPDTPPPIEAEAPPSVPPRITAGDDELTVENAHYAVRFGLSPTFRVLSLDGRHGVACGPGLFMARRGLDYYPSDEMTLAGAPRIEGSRVTLRLRPPEDLSADFELTLQADESPELRMTLVVENRGDEPLALAVSFPELRGLRIADASDTWYFYPSHCARLSRRPGANRWPYGGRFPLQFFSVFNPRAGRGVYVCTRDTSGSDRDYWLNKRLDGIDAGIDYPDSLSIPPGGRRELPPTVIGLHSGDWRQAFEAYRDWARTWYVPGNHRPEWFRNVTHMRTYWTQTENPNVRPVYDVESGEYRVDEILDAEEQGFGRIDYAHFFDYRISERYGRWGDYDDFSAIGGAEAFSDCLRQFERRGCRTGLYMEGFLASLKSKVAAEHGDEWGMRSRGGGPLVKWPDSDDPTLAMCLFFPGWRQHLAQVAVRLRRQFDVDGIYLDEFGFNSSGYFCWSAEHGHPVPGRPLTAVVAAIREVKEALPEDVALYTEECPADVASRHADGAFGYYLSFNEQPHTPGRLNAHRFAFPEFHLLPYSAHAVAQGNFIDQPKFALLNGLAFYTSGIILEPQGERLFREIVKVLQDHREAFNSPDAAPLLAGETPGLLVNCFPGAEETVYAVFNAAWHTVRGPVLRLPAGGRYEAIYEAHDLHTQADGDDEVVSLTIGPRAVACFARR